MFVYQKGKVINVVTGNLPKDNPEIQIGFENEEPIVRINGVNIAVGNGQGGAGLSQTIPFNGKDMAIENPDLKISTDGKDFYVSGTMAKAKEEVLKAWGYGEDVKHLFVVKVVFDGNIVPEEFTGTCVGTESKPITTAKFDGDNFIYYVFNGSVKEFTITYKSSNSEPERSFKIYNKATLAE